MRLERAVLVPYAAAEMFDIVEQAEHYPQFLPWCTSATIHERTDEWVAARIEFSYAKLRFGFPTRNAKKRPEWLKVRSVGGPFRHFHGDWEFIALGQAGCKVRFTLSYEIADGLLDGVAAAAVEKVSRSMVDAFVARAQATLTPLDARPATATELAAAQAVAPATAHTATATGASTMNDRTTSLIDALHSSPLAQDLSPEQLAVLAGVMHDEHLPAGAVLAREGSSDSRLYVIAEGQLAAVKGLGSSDETPLVTLQAGEFAHELGFLDGAQRYASLVAATGVRVLRLDRTELEGLIDSHPRLVYGVMRAILRAVHRIQARQSMQASELTHYITKTHGRY